VKEVGQVGTRSREEGERERIKSPRRGAASAPAQPLTRSRKRQAALAPGPVVSRSPWQSRRAPYAALRLTACVSTASVRYCPPVTTSICKSANLTISVCRPSKMIRFRCRPPPVLPPLRSIRPPWHHAEKRDGDWFWRSSCNGGLGHMIPVCCCDSGGNGTPSQPLIGR
jgi:hypothetical protein